jgi:hypothetical protein
LKPREEYSDQQDGSAHPIRAAEGNQEQKENPRQLRQFENGLSVARRANQFLISEVMSSLKIKNISLFPNSKQDYITSIPSRSEGRIMIVHERGTGCGGRW